MTQSQKGAAIVRLRAERWVCEPGRTETLVPHNLVRPPTLPHCSSVSWVLKWENGCPSHRVVERIH